MKSRLDVDRDVHISTEADLPAGELFAAALTAVLVADATTDRIIAANPAAQRLLGLAGPELVGHPWHSAFSATFSQALESAARRASASGAVVRTAVSSSKGRAELTATLSTFYVSEVSYLLIRLAPDGAAAAPLVAASSKVFEELDALPRGFVVTDGALCVEFGNRAFLEIVNQPSNDAVRGQCLLRWLNFTPADLSGMQWQMMQREARREMTTTLCIGPTMGPTVELTAVAVPDAISPHWGFILRRVCLPVAPARKQPTNA